MVITHFFNPAHLIPLVEIVQNKVPRPDVVPITLDLMRSIGKSPVLLNKEIPGFIANRLQIALAREVFHLLEEGVASAEDIDLAITSGPGFRWAFIGPIEIADFGGLDTWQRVFDNVAPVLNQSNQAPDILKDLVSQGKLGTKSCEGIFKYDAATVAHKIRERDRHFIRLGKIKGL
jgi:3-hydroxybutyryl-CoA dehydrogenase